MSAVAVLVVVLAPAAVIAVVARAGIAGVFSCRAFLYFFCIAKAVPSSCVELSR